MPCEDCLRRAWLVRILAPFISKACDRKPGSRTPELLSLDDEALAVAVAGERADELLSRAGELDRQAFLEGVDDVGAWACCRHDLLFPEALAGAADAPRALFGVGDPKRLSWLTPEATITVVGARKASAYGLEVARRLGSELAGSGLVVMSGMALGIDGAVHRGALGRGRTVAVLACGPDRAYPARHRGIYRHIACDGMVISEMPPGTAPWRWMFPARNRIMAALAGMTVVVEAAARSGSLITAEMATESGREVGAVPGRVTSPASDGTNELLANGAAVVRGAQDVLDRMLGVGVEVVAPPGPELEAKLMRLLDEVALEEANAAELAVRLGMSGAEIAVGLARLELMGYVEATTGGAYRPTGLRAPYPSQHERT